MRLDRTLARILARPFEAGFRGYRRPMVSRRRISWLIRAATRGAHGQMGSLWVALAAGVLIATIPIVALTGFEWNKGTEHPHVVPQFG